MCLCCVCADNRAAAERWLQCLESVGLRVVRSKEAAVAAAPRDSSTSTPRKQQAQTDAQTQDRYVHMRSLSSANVSVLKAYPRKQ